LNPEDSTANFLMQNPINSNGTIPTRKSQRSWSEKYHKAQHDHPQAPNLIQPRVMNPKRLDREFLDTKFRVNRQQWNSSGEEEPKELVSEKYHKAKHRQKINCAAWTESWARRAQARKYCRDRRVGPARPAGVR
jgi:hypothetical protein